MTAENLKLELHRDFQISRKQLFALFTTPESLKEWHIGKVSEAVMELKPGGRLLIRFSPDENLEQEMCLRGSYREVSIPERLVYTWQWEGSPEESLVTASFEPSEAGCRLSIRHEGFQSPESVSGHVQGWEACLDGLAKLIGK